jgi:phosphoglycerol transferase MdoB-like AlkP superfamily enzyme
LALFGHSLILVLASLLAAGIVSGFVDSFAVPAKVRAANASQRTAAGLLLDWLARLTLVALTYVLFFSISWRPIYAFAGTVSTFAIFTLISRAKFEYIRESLVFSDVALVMLVFRHKEMFYATWLNVVFWLASFTYVFGASSLFYLFEPSVLPAGAGALTIAAPVVLTVVPWLLLFNGRYREAASRIAAKLVGGDDINALTVRVGAFTAVLSGFLEWLGIRPVPVVEAAADGEEASARPTAPRRAASGRPLVVVWQSESFMDMRHFGVSSVDLPNLDRLRRRAAQWGRMSSIFEGGYTLRTEFSVISGLPPSKLGPDATYPYLNAGTYTDIAWPSRFRQAGWATRFLHPYDRQFFSRDRALPLLGFEELVMLDAFDHDKEHDGPYVSDMTLSKRLLQYCDGDHGKEGQFLFAASMENHGPWRPGRHGDSVDPVEIYLAILQRSDAALGYLADELDRMERPAWLVFYGDHAPVLKSFADPFPDPRTDYVIVPMSRAARGTRGTTEPAEKAPWNIVSDLVRQAGLHNIAEAA